MEGSSQSPRTDDDHESIAYLIERASLAIGRLDACVSASSAAAQWQLRAAWSGYARALQLTGVEIDEVDVFSWGSGVNLPHRARRHTLVNHFAPFEPWRERMVAGGRHWAEDLPFSVSRDVTQRRQPLLLRALALQARYLETTSSVDAWLSFPIFLYRLGMTECPLPCLVVGDRQLLQAPRDLGPGHRRILRALESAATRGRKSLLAAEDTQSITVAALAGERRPATLRQLAAILMRAPVQSPESISRRLKMTLSGAGKLLSRAASFGMVVEVSGRRAWRTYVVPDLAVSLGFAFAPKGRPPLRPEPSVSSVGLDALLLEFDREMAAFDARFPAQGDVA